jgi:HEAT repeat protein
MTPMKRALAGLGFVIALPALAGAQTPPPPPPPPAPAPVARPVLPALPAVVTPAPLPPRGVWDVMLPPVGVPAEAVFEAQEAMRRAQEEVRWSQEEMRWNMDQVREARVWSDRDFFQTRVGPMLGGSDYGSGLNYLQRREYEQAIARFDRAVTRANSQTDGALYWKAFAQYKLGRTDDALATIGTLRQNHAESRYLNDAKVLETDVRRVAGQRLTAEEIARLDDEDIKLLAIRGIQQSNPEGAIPLLEGVLTATHSLRVKQRALYVLALSDQPRARQILMNYAKGAGTPDLQMEAIRYIAANRNIQTTAQDLRQIYEATQDQAVRMAIISAYGAAGSKDHLISIVSTAREPVAIRQRAVSGLANIGSPQDLWALYQKETDSDLRVYMVSAFASMGATEQLQQIAQTEKDPAVRQRAIRSLGGRKSDETGQNLVALYSTHTDTATRKSIINALASQANAEGLVAIARKEASLELKRDIVSHLSEMAAKSKVAADYLLEVIK